MPTVLVWSLAVIMAGLGPLLLWVGGLEPPWPRGESGKIALLLSAVCAFGAANWKLRSVREKRRRVKFFFAAGLVLLFLYLFLDAFFVVDKSKIVSGEERRVRIETGIWIRKEISRAEYLALPRADLLDRYGNDPNRVWTPVSLNLVRLALVLTFSGGFAFLATGIIRMR